VAASPVGSTTKTQLRSKLLTLSNFPTGWTIDKYRKTAQRARARLRAHKNSALSR